MPGKHSVPVVTVGPGQTVQVYACGDLRGSAVRHGRGWAVLVDGQQHQVTTLDGVLALLRLLPEHHR